MVGYSGLFFLLFFFSFSLGVSLSAAFEHRSFAVSFRWITSVWRRLSNRTRHSLRKCRVTNFPSDLNAASKSKGWTQHFFFFMQLIGVMPSRFKNDCLINVCDRAVTCILGLNFICTYLVWFYCIWLIRYWWWFILSCQLQSRVQCWPSRSDYNEGLLFWRFGTVRLRVISGKSLDYHVISLSKCLVHLGLG